MFLKYIFSNFYSGKKTNQSFAINGSSPGSPLVTHCLHYFPRSQSHPSLSIILTGTIEQPAVCVTPHKWLASPQCSHFTPQQFLWKPQQVRPIKVSLDLKWDTRWIFQCLRAVWVSLWKRRLGGTAVRRIPVNLRLFLAKEVPVNYFLPLPTLLRLCPCLCTHPHLT